MFVIDDRYIFHIDVNSAFLSWEACHRLYDLHEDLDIRTIPSCIGGDITKRHGVVLAKSTPAKAFGIITGEPITQALKKCPTLATFPPDHQLYRKYSTAFISILKKYSTCIEQFSIDEAWCDMTQLVHSREEAVSLANTIKNEIKNTLGFTINTGISTNKLLAKMASDFKKPDMVHTLFPDEIPHKMWPLPVRELFFVGACAERKLYNLGIITIGDLAHSDSNLITKHFKKHGTLIHNYSKGIDNSPVNSEPTANKGYGNSTTLSFDITDYNTAEMILKDLADTVSKRLIADNARAFCISVNIRDNDFCDSSKQCTLSDSINSSTDLYNTAITLLKGLWNGHTPIRLLGIYTSHITYNELVQFTLADYKDGSIEKHNRLQKALSDIKSRYGDNAILTGSNFIKTTDTEL